MKKIVAIDARLVAGSYTGDSTYWTCLTQALRLAPTDWKFHLYSNIPRPSEIPETENMPWIHLPGTNSRWWSYVQFPLAARRHGALLTHTQYSISPLARGPVTTIHDVSFLIGPEWFQPKDRLLLATSVPAAARRAKAVITVSETSRKEIEAHILGSRGKTFATLLACPPWIQPVNPREAKTVAAQRFGLKEPYVLSVSTRWPRKNMELAIAAVQGSKSKPPLVLTGKAGWGDQSIPTGVLNTGYVDKEDLGALYSAASLYICPSRHEGFGLPVVEAFQCGCPVLCSSGGSLPEVASKAAWVQSGFDPESWSVSLDQLLSDSSKLHELRSLGLQRAAEFSWSETAKKTLEVYEFAHHG